MSTAEHSRSSIGGSSNNNNGNAKTLSPNRNNNKVDNAVVAVAVAQQQLHQEQQQQQQLQLQQLEQKSLTAAETAAGTCTTDHQQLHQTTQSLLMASSMLFIDAPAVRYADNTTHQLAAVPVSVPVSQMKINVETLLRENRALHEKLKEITNDRDRLLCEVANLRLELDMAELKRLPEVDETFPQKNIERSGSTQYDLAMPAVGSSTSTESGGGYVYLQNHYASSTNAASAINYPIIGPQPHMIYQIHPHPHAQQQQAQQQQYPTCHQQQQQHQQLIHQSGIAGHYIQASAHPHHHHMQHGGHHHHHHHGGAVVIAGSGVGTGMGMGGVTSPGAGIIMQQNLHKKNSMRNGGDVLKRTRAQSAYELSQDLLEKQIELLERKYGGVRARNAAITIQRAFRHYMMVKKFASITAMAKAEKRLSRRMVMNTSATTTVTSVGNSAEEGASLSSAYGSATESQLDMQHQQPQQQLLQQQTPQQQARVTITAGPPSGTSISPGSLARTPPTRSLSMRERRQMDCSPIPRSQSGASPVSIASCSSASSTSTLSSHPHVNLLHAAEPHYYNAQSILTAQQQQQHALGAPYYHGNYHMGSHETSYASSGHSSNLDSSLNASWVNTSGTSPHTPYYSATQIYMRPKISTGVALTPVDRKKVPPEVPKRTSSITAQQQQHLLMQRQTPPPPSMLRTNGLCKTAENGSLTSVQSSGSDSSATSIERNINSDLGSDRSNSPHTWKRGTNLNSSQQFSTHSSDSAAGYAPHMQAAVVTAVNAVGAIAPADDHAMSSHTSAAQYEHVHEQQQQEQQQLNAAVSAQNYKVSETIRKRQYRVGLNLFNKKPEKGITYLIRRGFLENTPQGVARFLITRKGLSRQMIGEYLGNLQNAFNMAVLNCFALELDLSGRQVDVALRKFQAYFRMPGEAQKIERLMEIFSQRFCQCNPDIVSRLRSSDTIFVLAFAIIMLNTDLHTPNLKPERRMRVEDFIKNLRGIDDCHDIDKDMLTGIYDRVKSDEFKPGSDHVTQVMKVQATIVGKKPNLALPHRRLVCYCRLYEIPDINKKERPGVHQREVFLFNDLLVITKIFSKKKSSVTYTFRNSFPLCGMVVSLLDLANYPFCIQLSQKVDGKILITFNARNEHDRCKFAEDLKESISEMDEMETLRIEAELERQKSARNRAAGGNSGGGGNGGENRDSGVADVEVCPCPYQPNQMGGNGVNGSNGGIGNGDAACIVGDPAQQQQQQQLKRSALSNSLLDMHEQFGNEKPQRRGSVGSLDSGMSISFQSTTTSSASRDNAAAIAAAANAAAVAKMRYTTATAVGVAGGNVYAAPGMQAYTHANFVQQTHAAYMLQQQQMQQQQQLQQQHQQLQQQQQQLTQQQQPLTGRIPGRDRKHSHSDDNARSTEV